MKVIFLVLAAVAAVAVGEQLPLNQPEGYRIKVPSIPFTSDEVRHKPAQQYSAAASAPTVPAQQYSKPAPAQQYSRPAPAQQYSKPAPAQQYSKPAPTQQYSKPAPAQQYSKPAPAQQYQAQAPAQYDFSYAVDSYDVAGNKLDFGHNEQRDGGQTTGSYYILLPDTRRMRVEYYVDETGFHPTYTYEGEAAYPQATAPSKLYAQPGRK